MQSHTPISKLRSNLSTMAMEYLAVNKAIFTQMLMSKKEQFTRENHAIYKKTFSKAIDLLQGLEDSTTRASEKWPAA